MRCISLLVDARGRVWCYVNYSGRGGGLGVARYLAAATWTALNPGEPLRCCWTSPAGDALPEWCAQEFYFYDIDNEEKNHRRRTTT